MRFSRLVVVISTVLVLQLTGCGADTSSPKFIRAPEVVKNPNASAPLAAVLRFSASEPVRTFVTISDGSHERQVTFPDTLAPSDGLPLIGLRPGRDHQIYVTIEDTRGNRTTASQPLTYRTPPLPEGPAEFPAIEVTVRKPDKMEPGYTLLNPRRRIPRQTQLGSEDEREFGANFGMLLIVDAEGTPVWYYRTDSRISDYDVLDNGHLQYVTQDFRVVEIDMLGKEIESWYAANRPHGLASATPVPTLTFHHDADRLPSGHLLALSSEQRMLENYYTSEYDPDAPRKTQPVMGDRIVEFDQEGNIVWTWNAFEHMDPYRIGYETFIPYWKRRGFPKTIDWSHANALVYDEADDAVLINFRLQSAILKIDRKTGEVLWVFGEPSGWPEALQDKIIQLEGDARWFWHQHSPTLTSRGTLLLFDNGNYRARPFDEPVPIDEAYSRAVEYEIDEENLTARQVWSSEMPGEEQVLSIAMGSVSDLPETGHVLAGYGAVFEEEGLDEVNWQTRARVGQWTMAREFSRSSPPDILWEMQLNQTGGDPQIGWTIFGVKRIPALYP